MSSVPCALPCTTNTWVGSTTMTISVAAIMYGGSAWKDNRVVNVASTLADPTELTTVKRRQKDGTRIDVKCPLCIALYNEYMGGVDYNDHLRGSYHVRWKCMKNYKYVFSLFDVSITNAFILHSYDVRSSPPMDQKHFRLMLAEQLIGSYQRRI